MAKQQMSWQYIAGYIDGEGSLLMGVCQDKRNYKSEIEHYTFIPSMCIQSYDNDVLLLMRDFLQKEEFSTVKFDTRKSRDTQTQNGYRLSINGYKNLKIFIDKIYLYSIAKKSQYDLFYQIYDVIINQRKRSIKNVTMWTKVSWLKVMYLVTELNSHKKGLRGRNWYQFFSQKWKMKI